MARRVLAQVLLLLLAIAAAVPAQAANYDIDWSSGVDYSSWPSDKTIHTGDTLTFKYGGLHSVYEVSQADYEGCATSNSISSYSDGNTVITLDKPGTRYFVCGAFAHCGLGMKISIPVSAAGGSTTSTTTDPLTPSTLSSPGKQQQQPSSPSAAAALIDSLPGVKGFIMAGAVLVGVASLLLSS